MRNLTLLSISIVSSAVEKSTDLGLQNHNVNDNDIAFQQEKPYFAT